MVSKDGDVAQNLLMRDDKFHQAFQAELDKLINGAKSDIQAKFLYSVGLQWNLFLFHSTNKVRLFFSFVKIFNKSFKKVECWFFGQNSSNWIIYFFVRNYYL